LFKGAKVGDYNGKNLSVGGGAVVQINPDIPESHKLRGWFDQGGSESTFQELSNTAQVGGGSTLQANWKHLGSLKSESLGMQDKPDYITCKAIVLFCKKDNSMYMACPADTCNKKVVDQNDGEYRCEKCNKSYDKFKWRFVMSVR
jgi:replication factor A1